KMHVAPSALADAELSLLTDEAELALIKKIAQFPRTAEGAAQAHEPHRIAFFVHDLASVFHGLWTRGKELPQLRFIVEGGWPLTKARPALITAAAQIIRSSLNLLGVEAISEMR